MKKILYIIILLLIISCNKKQDMMKEEYIYKLSNGNYRNPSKYGGVSLYILSDEGDIVQTNSDHLNYVYVNHYLKIYKTYKEFLINVLNNNNKIPKKEFGNISFKSFKIDNEIKKKYQNQSFNNFINEFTVNLNFSKDKFELKSENKSYQEIMTISYYFYINGYQVQVNDYHAKYIVVKRDDIFKN